MPRRKKTYKPEIMNPEDVTLALRNTAVIVRNFLDQRVEAALKKDKTGSSFKGRSRQTLREITQMYYDELVAYTEDRDGFGPYLLGEELCLSFCAAAFMVHARLEGKKINAEDLFQ